MATVADLMSVTPISDGEKVVFCAALAAGSAALEHWLIFRQGPRLIELTGSVIMQLIESTGNVASAAATGTAQVVSTGLAQPAALAGAISPFGGGGGGGGTQALSSVLPFLLSAV